MRYLKALMISAAIAALAIASPASAEMTAQELIKKIDENDPKYLTYMIGITTGIEWTNTWANTKLFCPPLKIEMAAEQNLQMLRRIIKESPDLSVMPAGMVLLQTYLRTFPCPAKQD